LDTRTSQTRARKGYISDNRPRWRLIKKSARPIRWLGPFICGRMHLSLEYRFPKT
jgi:hypothetical protein